MEIIFYKDKFKEARKLKGLSMSELAKQAGTSRESISIWERGIRSPHPKHIKLLAAALDIEINQISNLNSEKKSSPIKLYETKDAWLRFIKEDNVLNNRIDMALNIISTLKIELSQVKFVLQALISGLNSILYIKDKNCKYVIANNAFLENIFLTEKFNTTGKEDADFFPIKEAEINTKEDLEILSSGKSITNVEAHIPGSRKKKTLP